MTQKIQMRNQPNKPNRGDRSQPLQPPRLPVANVLPPPLPNTKRHLLLFVLCSSLLALILFLAGLNLVITSFGRKQAAKSGEVTSVVTDFTQDESEDPAMDQNTSSPESSSSEASGSEASGSEASGSEASSPEASSPEASSPEASSPEASNSENDDRVSAVGQSSSRTTRSLNFDPVQSDVTASQHQDSTDGGQVGSGSHVGRGANAVSKGSFTVWTIPQSPEPRQDYVIVIEISVPPAKKTYPLSDLSGVVIGTDSYKQALPQNAHIRSSTGRFFAAPASRGIRVRDNRVQLFIQVPGAARLVRDRIAVSSKMLNEKQTLDLVFGK